MRYISIVMYGAFSPYIKELGNLPHHLLDYQGDEDGIKDHVLRYYDGIGIIPKTFACVYYVEFNNYTDRDEFNQVLNGDILDLGSLEVRAVIERFVHKINQLKQIQLRT